MISGRRDLPNDGRVFAASRDDRRPRSTGSPDRVLVLRRTQLFSSLTDTELSVLGDELLELDYAKGEVVHRQGDAADRVFLIGEGYVKQTVASSGGAGLIVEIAGPGGVFGQLAAISRRPQGSSARTLSPCKVFALGAPIVRALAARRPAFAIRLLELAAEQVWAAHRNSQELVSLDAEARLARRLLALVQSHPMRGGRPELGLDVQLSQEDLAQMIGVTRSSANRLLASFGERGWLNWNQGRPRLLDLGALSQLAN